MLPAVVLWQDYNEAVLRDFHARVVEGELGSHAHASGLETLLEQVWTVSFCASTF